MFLFIFVAISNKLHYLPKQQTVTAMVCTNNSTACNHCSTTHSSSSQTSFHNKRENADWNQDNHESNTKIISKYLRFLRFTILTKC